jgi:outer membrane protein
MNKESDEATERRSDAGKDRCADPFPSSLHRFVASSLLLLGVWGCKDYGAGGTGELVVPREELHDVKHMQLEPTPATEPTTLPTTEPAAESVELSIEQVRRDALANNLDLRVQLFDPTIASESLKAERAKFESVFTTDANYAVNNSPTATPGIAGTQSNNLRVDPGIRIPLITGGQITVDAPQDRNVSNNPAVNLGGEQTGSTDSVFYTSDINASISLPLMRGFGVAPNAQSIRIAFYESQAAQARTKLEVIRVLTDAEKTYWLLYAARRELEVRKKQYDLAVAQLDRARRQVQAGTLPEVEITRAESGVSDTVEQIILADNNLRQQQRDLKRIMNRDDLQMRTPTVIVPSTVPNASAYRTEPDQLVRESLRNRMDLLQTELQIASDTANVEAARNGTLPLLSLQYTYGINGLGQEYFQATRQVRDKHFEDHFVGLHLEVPIGNEPARAQLRSALARRLQTLASKDQQTVQITQEVYNAIDTLQAAWESILAAQKRTILNARLLDVEIRAFNQGLRTSTEVLDAQTKLADAQSAEIRAVTAYQISQVDLAFATGTVLGESRVDWAPMAAPRE